VYFSYYVNFKLFGRDSSYAGVSFFNIEGYEGCNLRGINETLLEMIYFFPIKEALSSVFGNKINAIYKPSPQKEAWLGFDQAWVNNEISENEFYKLIQDKSKDIKFLAYILQFKVVERISYVSKKRSFYVPNCYTNEYFRVPLKTEPSKTAPISQHELLCDLKEEFPFLEIYYACPMLFSQQEDLFQQEYMENEGKLRSHLIDKLILVDVGSAPDRSTFGPAGWSSYKKHHIIWQDDDGNDMQWCSFPERGKKLYCREWIEQIIPSKVVNNEELLKMIKDINYFNKLYSGNGVQRNSDLFSSIRIIEFK
jgi:hypothetical protein